MDGVDNRGPVDVRWSGLARALGLGPFGGLVVDVLCAKGTVNIEMVQQGMYDVRAGPKRGIDSIFSQTIDSMESSNNSTGNANIATRFQGSSRNQSLVSSCPHGISSRPTELVASGSKSDTHVSETWTLERRGANAETVATRAKRNKIVFIIVLKFLTNVSYNKDSFDDGILLYCSVVDVRLFSIHSSLVLLENQGKEDKKRE